MTVINVKYRRPDGENLEGVAVTSGTVLISPAVRYDTTSGEMLPVNIPSVLLTSPAPSVTLAPGPYRVEIQTGDGAGGVYSHVTYVDVPATGTFDIDDLAEIDPQSFGHITRVSIMTIRPDPAHPGLYLIGV